MTEQEKEWVEMQIKDDESRNGWMKEKCIPYCEKRMYNRSLSFSRDHPHDSKRELIVAKLTTYRSWEHTSSCTGNGCFRLRRHTLFGIFFAWRFLHSSKHFSLFLVYWSFSLRLTRSKTREAAIHFRPPTQVIFLAYFSDYQDVFRIFILAVKWQ